MRLLQINTTVNSGSTGRIADGIGIAAQKAGFDSWIAYGRCAKKSSSHLIKIGSNLDHYEHAVETRLFDNHGLASRTATICFLKKIDKIKPDLVHLHNIHGYFLNYKIFFQFIQEKKIPIVWTIHDCWPFTGHCAYFTTCGCDKWINGCFSCPQSKTYPSSCLFDRSKKNFIDKKSAFLLLDNLTLVSVSQWLNDLVSQSFFKKYNHIYIYNGVDTNTFSPSSNSELIRCKLGFKQDETMLLGVACPWSERKGFQDFIDLSKVLSPKQRIVLIGLTKKQIEGLPHNIIGIERTESTKQLAEYYSAADITLNLSKEETFGLTTVEGFSCGTPAIGYNCTATPELITSNTGYIVSAGDHSSLLACINAIQKNGKQFYSSACRNHALAHFRQEDRFQEYIELYKQILHL